MEQNNPAIIAMKELQEAMKDETNLPDEEEIISLVKEIRDEESISKNHGCFYQEL